MFSSYLLYVLFAINEFVGSGCIVCGAGSIKRYGVRPSACPAWAHSSKPTAAGLLLLAWQTVDID